MTTAIIPCFASVGCVDKIPARRRRAIAKSKHHPFPLHPPPSDTTTAPYRYGRTSPKPKQRSALPLEAFIFLFAETALAHKRGQRLDVGRSEMLFGPCKQYWNAAWPLAGEGQALVKRVDCFSHQT